MVWAPGNPALRRHLASAALVAAWVGLAQRLVPDPARREELQYLLVLPLGYGHLLGALIFSRRRLAGLAPSGGGALFGAFVATSALTAFAAYAWTLRAMGPVLLLPLLAIFGWHALENELALGRVEPGGLRVGALPREADHHLLAAGGAVLLLLAAATSRGSEPYVASLLAGAHAWGVPAARLVCIGCGAALLLRNAGSRRGWLGAGLALAGFGIDARRFALADVVVAATLYHVASWLLFFADRVRTTRRTRPAEARRLAARLAGVHALPLAACLAVHAAEAEWLAPLRFALVAPSIYLFWSALHVLQTALVRGLEPRRA